MRGVAWWGQWRTVVAPVILGVLVTGCVSFSDGPARLYTVPEETQLIRENIQQLNLIQYSSLDEASRRRIRNDWIGARMYAIDIQYTPYEAALTKERQGVGFGAATTTIALTTASGLVGPVATKNVLTGLAGLVTGARAAYDSDILLSHSVQWIQSQMEAKRSEISSRILRGMKLSTTDYPLAAALSDLEAYYRAGTFTGGLLSANQVLAADAQQAAEDKAAAQGILDPEAPLPPALPRTPPFKDKPPPQDVTGFQAALCVSQDGKVGPDLLKAAGNFISASEGGKPPKLTAMSKRTEAKLRDAEELVPDCRKAGFKSAFEVGAFGVPSGSFAPADRIKELQKILKVTETGKLDQPTRDAVARLRRDKIIDPQLVDEIDRNFMLKIMP
jgi:hypothetical protein